MAHLTVSETIVPALSPGFSRARKLSRFIAVLFALGFLVMLSGVISAVVFIFIPKTPSGVSMGIGFLEGFGVGFGSLTHWQAIGTMVGVEAMTVPIVIVLYHMSKLFLCFARGEVFAAKPIAYIRAAGFWLTLSFFTGIAAVYLFVLCGQTNGLLGAIHHFPGSLPAIALRFENAIFTGIPLIIAAYVMEEARRIAADHAEIV